MPGDSVREETEVTSRLATQAELEALGYTGDVIVTQTIRTTFQADGTPIGKTLTIQGGSTPIVFKPDPGSDEQGGAVAIREPVVFGGAELVDVAGHGIRTGFGGPGHGSVASERLPFCLRRSRMPAPPRRPMLRAVATSEARRKEGDLCQ